MSLVPFGAATLLVATATGAVAQDLRPDAALLIDGMAHLLTVPDNVMALVGLGLVAGRSGRAGRRTLVAVYLAGLAAACLLSSVTIPPAVLFRLSLVLSLWLGLLAAADLDPPAWLVCLLGATAGFAVGLDVVPFGRVDPLILAKVVLGAAVLSSLVWLGITCAVSLARAPWQRIAVRIAGSWLAAIAALLIALEFAR